MHIFDQSASTTDWLDKIMKKELLKIDFDNHNNPKSYFDVVKIEDLLQRKLNHDIYSNHLVKFYIIFFVFEGNGNHSIDFKTYNYEKGTVLLIRRDQIHQFFKSVDVKGYLLIFTEEFIISHLNKMEALKAMQLFNDALSFPKIQYNNLESFTDISILVKHIETEYQVKDDFSIGITRSALHILITKLFRIKAKQGYISQTTSQLSQFLEFQKLVEEDCFESRQVKYYAQKMVISTKTLNNIVQSTINESAKTFIDERTIMQIKRLLISTDHSVKEIAYTAGFSDPANFYKYFKKLTGNSPEVFRQAH